MRYMVLYNITVLLAHHSLSSLAYPITIYTPLVLGNLPIRTLTLVARHHDL